MEKHYNELVEKIKNNPSTFDKSIEKLVQVYNDYTQEQKLQVQISNGNGEYTVINKKKNRYTDGSSAVTITMDYFKDGKRLSRKTVKH